MLAGSTEWFRSSWVKACLQTLALSYPGHKRRQLFLGWIRELGEHYRSMWNIQANATVEGELPLVAREVTYTELGLPSPQGKGAYSSQRSQCWSEMKRLSGLHREESVKAGAEPLQLWPFCSWIWCPALLLSGSSAQWQGWFYFLKSLLPRRLFLSFFLMIKKKFFFFFLGNGHRFLWFPMICPGTQWGPINMSNAPESSYTKGY